MARVIVLLVACLPVVAPALHAQVRVHPNGVSVNAMNATTVFLTFGGVTTTLRPAEALWCGELVSAAPDRGSRCDPATIFGRLPTRYDLARSSGVNGFTDIMSIPASVARRAYQDARGGARSTFFYVRRFENMSGGPDEFVSVICRLTGGGARVPFGLVDVRVKFEGPEAVAFVRSGGVPAPLSAEISYNGTGRMTGRWEVVFPGEDAPTAQDLLPESSLPIELRAGQRRYAQLQRFSLFVPPGGKLTLPGPDPARLPTTVEGSYLVLLRIESTDDCEGDTDLGSVGAGTGSVHSGAVAGFAMPVLRYVVLGDGAVRTRDGVSRLAQIAPRDGGSARRDSSFLVVWSPSREATFFRVEVETATGARAVSAIVPRSTTHYEVPPFVWERAATSSLRWRVTALDGGGELLQRTGWRRIGAAGVLDVPASPASGGVGR